MQSVMDMEASMFSSISYIIVSLFGIKKKRFGCNLLVSPSPLMSFLINLAMSKSWAEWLHNPCLLGGPQQGEEIRSGYTTPVFSGPQQGDRIRSGCTNPAFLGAQRKCPKKN